MSLSAEGGFIDPGKLSKDDIRQLFHRIDEKSCGPDADGHIIWQKCTSADGYPRIRLGKDVEKKLGMTAAVNPANVMYACANKVQLCKQNYHVSHLCHYKLCINPAHLNYEPDHVNCQRDKCQKNKKCVLHYVIDEDEGPDNSEKDVDDSHPDRPFF